MASEIERKFLLSEAPEWLGECPSEAIEQGYLAVEGDRAEVRLRRLGEALKLGVKRGSGLSRDEVEVELKAEQFEALWGLTEGRRLSKRRHLRELDEGTLEIDVYEGELAGTVTAEMEFDSEEDAAAFEVPEWLGEELTGDGRWSNRSLAIAGRPGPTPPPADR